MDARRAFLGELIDDAGLFPPASLSMEAATEQHAASRAGRHAWMLGRFLCPASRLEELRKHLRLLDRWRLSVIVDGPDGGRDLAAWLGDPPPGTAVEIVEMPSWTGDLGPAAALTLDRERIPVFLEVRPDAPVGPELAAIERSGNGAKLRCGGATAGHVPSPARVAEFIDGCRVRGLRFKATAGLHHPLRHADPETGVVQHGFVNLVGAAVLARAHDLGRDDILPIIEESDPEAFALSPERVSWRGLEAGPEQVAGARADLFLAFGSCDFDEPVADLLDLGILPA